MARKAFDSITPDELFEKIKDSVIELFDLRWDKGISHELSHDEFFDVVCDETEALDLNVDEDTLYDTATKAKKIVNAFLQKKSQDLSNPSDKRCKGKYLASVINDLSGSDDELAIALGYYTTNDEDEKVALVDEFLMAKEECIKEGVNGISRFSEEYFDVYKGRLVMMDEHGGNVFVPKRLVEENKEFYKESELVDVTIENLVEVLNLDEEEAEEYIKDASFGEPFMVQTVTNMIYVNSWDLEWKDGEYSFTNEEIADYWGLRYEDCDLTRSSWSDG